MQQQRHRFGDHADRVADHDDLSHAGAEHDDHRVERAGGVDHLGGTDHVERRLDVVGSRDGGRRVGEGHRERHQSQVRQGAVIETDSDGRYRLTVKSLTPAPQSAYAVANLNKTNGKMYYVNYEVTNLGGSKYGFHATSVNFLWLRPVFDSSQKGRAGGAPYQDLPGCKKAAYDDIAVGRTASACYYYQITGTAPTKVMWNDYDTQIVWSK